MPALQAQPTVSYPWDYGNRLTGITHATTPATTVALAYEAANRRTQLK